MVEEVQQVRRGYVERRDRAEEEEVEDEGEGELHLRRSRRVSDGDEGEKAEEEGTHL